MLVAGEATVVHRLLGDGARPCFGVAEVAPGIEALLVLDVFAFVGDGGPICFTAYHNMVDFGGKDNGWFVAVQGVCVTNLPTRGFDYKV